ncbi:hypothetical protein HK414_12975 [Ramlibacter terrae]|uniref:Uncharacterized protein n=1 Tax=Ramlibacter terrae TaxID=2732511 RepID=A0ABX6P2S5_9BURK|nr:hypothetical protein HK414_12975 [Ramlibacter terrae]
MKNKRKGADSRSEGRFIMLPHVVLDSPAYRGLTVHARALMIDLARQYMGANNGTLLCSRNKMQELGWTSNDMLTKAKRELLDARLLFQTVQGQRPNKASWYALTWFALARNDSYDAGTVETFRRGMYQELRPQPSREALYDKWRTPAVKTESLDRPTVQEAA